MIHLDYADGTSAWLTDEQLKEKHPELWAKLRAPGPHAEIGQKLRKIRIKYDVSQMEMAKRIGIKPSEISKIERGEVEASQEICDFYSMLSLGGKP